MIIRAYLRASTHEQDATRAKQQLQDFISGYGLSIATYYAENASGATLARPELMRLLDEANSGDVILVEQIDRLARLKSDDWETLKKIINEKGIRIVSPELPTSHIQLQAESKSDDFTSSVIRAVNGMLLDLLAATARKDYEDRRRRQAQGIEKAKQAKKYAGRPEDLSKQKVIRSMLKDGSSYSEIIEALGCSRALIAKVSKQMS